MKYLLREFQKLCDGGVCQDFLTELEKKLIRDDGAMFLTGIAQRANFKNGNGRIYSKPILEREVNNYNQLVLAHRAIGELDHPDAAVVELQNASHKITDIWWQGDDVMVKLKVLSSPAGQTLRALVNDGVAIGLSSRGLGSVKETREGIIVEDDFQLICFDVVSEPSTQGAFMKLMEAKIGTSVQKIFSDKEYRIRKALTEVLNK